MGLESLNSLEYIISIAYLDDLIPQLYVRELIYALLSIDARLAAQVFKRASTRGSHARVSHLKTN